eukprot:c24812_g5_i1 orf=1-375(-)
MHQLQYSGRMLVFKQISSRSPNPLLWALSLSLSDVSLSSSLFLCLSIVSPSPSFVSYGDLPENLYCSAALFSLFQSLFRIRVFLFFLSFLFFLGRNAHLRPSAQPASDQRRGLLQWALQWLQRCT